MKGDKFGGKRANWLLIKHRDDYAVDGDGGAILEEDRSVASGRSMETIAAGKGRGPRPFMLTGKAAAEPDAVWDTSDAPKAKRAKPNTASRSPKSRAQD